MINRHNLSYAVAAFAFVACWIIGVRFGFPVFLSPILRHISIPSTGAVSPLLLSLVDGVQIIWTALLALIFCRIMRRSGAAHADTPFMVQNNLAGAPGRMRLWGLGLIVGAMAFSLLMGILTATGVYAISVLPALTSIWSTEFFALIVLFLIVGFVEEFVFRGYLLTLLTQAFGFWAAAIVSAALFGAIHFLGAHDDMAGSTQTVLFGIAAALSVRTTGTLWFACGFHTTWDFFETAIWGVPNGGVIFPGTLGHATATGPVWASGGSAGPEGGLPCTVTFLVFAIVAARIPRRHGMVR